MSAKRKRYASECEYGDVDGAVDYFTSRVVSTRRFKVYGNVALKKELRVLERAAYERGLSAGHINALVDILVKSKFPKTLKHSLIKCLVPAEVVTEDSVVRLFFWTISSQPTLDTQALIFRWMIIIFDDIEAAGISRLRQLYGFMFTMLNNVSLRPHLCHLLHRLTVKDHVRPFRIRCLLQLLRTETNPPNKHSPVSSLLRIYSQHQPELLENQPSFSQKVSFPVTDQEWAARVRAVTIRRRTNEIPRSISAPQPSQNAERNVVVPSLVPGDGRNATLKPGSGQAKVACSQIKNFTQLVDCFESIKLPKQIVSVLTDKLLRYSVACSTDAKTILRLEYWFQNALLREFQNCDSTSESRQAKVLQVAVEFSTFIQEGIPVCEDFLSSYLCSWNGFTHRRHILNLLTQLRLRAFEEIRDKFLEPLRKLFSASSVYFKCQLLFCCKELLVKWCCIDYHRHQQRMEIQERGGKVSDIYYLFPLRNIGAFSAMKTIEKFIKFVDRLSVVGLRQERFNILLTHFVLQFHEEASQLCSRYQIPIPHLPSVGIVYGCLFHRNAFAVSGIVSIICQCRDAYHALRHGKIDVNVDSVLFLKRKMYLVSTKLNEYTLDVCDTLWRCLAFSDRQSKTSRLNVLSQSAVASLDLPSPSMSVSVFLHRAMLGYAAKFLDVTQSPGVTVHPSLIMRHKEVYVKFLSQNHITSIEQLVNSCIIAVNRRESDVEGEEISRRPHRKDSIEWQMSANQTKTSDVSSV